MSREESLARFFKTTPKLDKKLLGDYISRPDQLEVLKAFMKLMEFDGVSLRPHPVFPRRSSSARARVDRTLTDTPSHDFDNQQKIICDAMRELLEQFRLPGESQQINRITETFAEVYFETKPGTPALHYDLSPSPR